MGNYEKTMKLLAVLFISAFANPEHLLPGYLPVDEVMDDGFDHDSGAMIYCHGKPKGLYRNPKDCTSYYSCINMGQTGDRINCEIGKVFNPNGKSCTWPGELESNDPCFQ